MVGHFLRQFQHWPAGRLLWPVGHSGWEEAGRKVLGLWMRGGASYAVGRGHSHTVRCGAITPQEGMW